MKKVFIILFSVFFSILLISTPTPSRAATPVEDQYCDNESVQNVDGYWLIKSHTSLSQTFTPSKNRLTSVQLAIAGGADITAPIKMDIYVVGGGLVTSKTETTQFAAVSWLEFTFPTVTIDTTKQYKITVTTTSSTAYWVVSLVPCYAGGTAIINTSPDPDQDFGFVTFGWDYVAPAPEPEEEEEAITIAKPTNVQAEFISPFDGVNITWSASATADITGYHIYRSESETTGYTKIGSVAKTLTEYLEQAEFEEETTYYYQVKAYKGTVLSEASNTASVDIPTFEENEESEEPVEILTTDESPTKKWLNNIINYIIGGGIILTAIVVLVIILIIKKKKSKETKDVKPEIKKEEVKTETVPVEPEVKEEVIKEEKKE